MNYETMDSAELNAAIAVRVCGWVEAKAYMADHAEGYPSPEACGQTVPSYCTNLNSTFAAQSALAAKGEEYAKKFCVALREMITAKLESNASVPFLAAWNQLTAPARVRCIAMLQAVDAVESAS